jgi:hypothetical protein
MSTAGIVPFLEILGILGHDLRLGVRGAVRLDLGDQMLKRRRVPSSSSSSGAVPMRLSFCCVLAMSSNI